MSLAHAKPGDIVDLRPLGRVLATAKSATLAKLADLKLNQYCHAQRIALLDNHSAHLGTVKDGRIEIQGDQRRRIRSALEGFGYRVKQVGG